jgi:hypothetical protein
MKVTLTGFLLNEQRRGSATDLLSLAAGMGEHLDNQVGPIPKFL